MDVIRDTTSQYPMMLPTPSQFAKYMSNLHITPDDVLVIYDPMELGFYSSPRVAWTCQHFGHKAVHVLNTFPRYVAEGFPVVSGKAEPASTNASTATYPEQPLSSDENVMSFEELRDIITNPTHNTGNIQIIDARPASRFTAPPDIDTQTSTLPVGHIPRAINVPFTSLVGVDKTVLPPVELAELFAKAGVRNDVPAVLYCNTGVTAAGLDLALRVGGFGMQRWLYDGSWSEWTKRVDVDGALVDGVIS